MNLLLQYLQLCRFKNHPLDLQPSQNFFIKNLLIYLALGIIVEANISDPADATLEISVETLVTVTLVAVFLFFKKRLIIFKPLLTALIMAENVVFVLGILTEILDMFVQNTEYELIPALIGAGLVIWLAAIIAYIIRKTFDYPKSTSTVLSVFYIILTFLCPFLFMEVI